MLDSIIQKPILSPDAKVRKTSLNTHSCSTPQQVTHSPGLSWRTQNLFLLQHLVTHWSHVADNLKRKISLAAVTSWLVPSPHFSRLQTTNFPLLYPCRCPFLPSQVNQNLCQRRIWFLGGVIPKNQTRQGPTHSNTTWPWPPTVQIPNLSKLLILVFLLPKNKYIVLFQSHILI